MAYFQCMTAATMAGVNLIVTCSESFSGTAITCTDGDSYTKTLICPASSPYEVTFENIPTGVFTISGTAHGTIRSTTITVLDYTAVLNDIPDGSTITPTDDVQILLNCADIFDKSYTTISELLADTTSLLAVISDNNAVDYLARSTTFATSVCSDATAMTYIGANNYCADTLLADSTWLAAIVSSTYIESVLNGKVPTMTSNTSPSGQAAASTQFSSDYAAWKAFDNNNGTRWAAASDVITNQRVQYKFTKKVCIKAVGIYPAYLTNKQCVKNYKIQVCDTGGSWITLKSGIFSNTNVGYVKIPVENDTSYDYAGFYVQDSYNAPTIWTLQFYYRDDV